MYFADTNVYLDAIESPAFLASLAAFITRHGPLLVSSVVVAELVLGAARPAQHQSILKELTAGGLAQAPNEGDWAKAAIAVARLESGPGKSRSFWNDALLAAQSARLRCTLITSNRADFERLQRAIPVSIAPPFPA